MKITGDKKRWWLKGSYTVECTFVVPIILGMIFALLYVLFYEHDKLVARGNIRNGIVTYATEEKEIPESAQWERQVQSQLWMGKVTKATISQNSFTVKAVANIQLHLSIPVLHDFLEEKQEIHCEMRWEAWNPAQRIRWKGAERDEGV